MSDLIPESTNFTRSMTDVQQAVPVAQFDWRLIAKAAGEHGVRYRTNTALLAFLDEIEPARKADRFDPALPCKSGEGAGEREARKLLIDFMTSTSYDPHAKRHGDTVEAAIRFTIASLASDENAKFVAMVSRLTHTGDDGWTPPEGDDDSSAALDGIIAKARDIRSALTSDATQTREANEVERQDAQIAMGLIVDAATLGEAQSIAASFLEGAA